MVLFLARGAPDIQKSAPGIHGSTAGIHGSTAVEPGRPDLPLAGRCLCCWLGNSGLKVAAGKFWAGGWGSVLGGWGETLFPSPRPGSDDAAADHDHDPLVGRRLLP